MSADLDECEPLSGEPLSGEPLSGEPLGGGCPGAGSACDGQGQWQHPLGAGAA